MKDLSRLRLNDIRELLMSLLKRENDVSPKALLNSSGTKGTPTVAAMLEAEAKAGLNKTDRAVASDATTIVGIVATTAVASDTSTTDSARILDVHRG
ncbi:hypothetical protein PC116_g7475 [Phytophthora cactorum]|nr:hypothetical protein Pcac1_g19690 [Phytophthora cactorum]KAG2803941.1 hypothetical protein PC111_g18478 [Phytophthora cactorum]KAG4244702.1 hypothetical protein PC116_g7475 [Phytophthora cactorum]